MKCASHSALRDLRLNTNDHSTKSELWGKVLKVITVNLFFQADERAVLLLILPVTRNRLLIPVSWDEDKVLIAAANPADQEPLDWLRANFPRPHRLVLAGPQDVLFAIERAYHPIPRRAGKKLLGELLLEAGVIEGGQLEEALRVQKRTGETLGDVIEELGFVSRKVIEERLSSH